MEISPVYYSLSTRATHNQKQPKWKESCGDYSSSLITTTQCVNNSTPIKVKRSCGDYSSFRITSTPPNKLQTKLSGRKLWRLLQFSKHLIQEIYDQEIMKSFFYEKNMWCESKDPRVQNACKLLLSEELKSFVCIIVVCLIAVNMLSLIRDPFNKCINFCKKKIQRLDQTQEIPS